MTVIDVVKQLASLTIPGIAHAVPKIGVFTGIRQDAPSTAFF